MSLLDHSPPLNDQERVRILWDKFERWAQSQRKLLERRRADIFYKQNAQRKKLSSRERNHTDDDEITNQQLEAAAEDHMNMLLNEWHKWREDERLGPDAWGERTDEEADRIARLFQTEDAIDRVPPPFHNVYTPQTAPVYTSAPRMTSAARQSNHSASTSSSRSMYVDPSSLATDDDEAYDEEDSFQLTTDGSDNDFWVPSKHRGLHSKSSTQSSQNGSPDHLSSSGSSGYEILQPPHLSSSVLETHMEPPKRPPDTDRKGKARARGPVYVGPHLLSPEESNDEDDFTTFRMQTRIDKIWEFHLAAARADVELAMAIQNELMSKNLSWEDSEHKARISEHQKRMEELRDEKERERQQLVDAERKKRKEQIGKRSALREYIREAPPQQDWESLFQASQPVRFDAEKRAFALGPSSLPDETLTRNAYPSASHVDVPASAPLNNFGTVRARQQPQTNAPSSSSGWKTKHKPSPPTVTSAKAQASTSPDSRLWFTDTNDESFDFDGISAQNSTPVPPIPAGWGEKPSATSLLKKALSDPSRKHSSLSSFVEPNSNVDLDIVSKSVSGFAPGKKPVKNPKARQLGFDYDAGESSTVNTNARSFAGMALPRDIMQTYRTYPQTDDEMSLTPRPGMASALGSSTSWKTSEQDMLARQAKLPVRRSQFEDDDGWGNINELAGKAMGAMIPQEDPHRGMIQRQGIREGTAWGRSMQSGSSVVPTTKQSPPGPELTPWQQQQQKVKSRVQPSERAQPVSTLSNVPKAEDVQEDFWAAARAQLNVGANQSAVGHHSDPEETPWQRMERLKAGRSLPSAAGPSKNPFDQPPARKGLHSSKLSWSGPSNLEHSLADMTHHQPPSAPAQSSSKYWTPNGSGNASQMWNGNAQSTAKHSMTMPGGYVSDTQQVYDRFGGSSQGKSRMRSSYTKHPTVEEEPDEDGPDGRDGQVGALPYNSRFLLDVAVPKPIRPPEAYSEVIDYGEEFDEENDWDNGLSSAVQTPSTAPTSPPGDTPPMSEEWMNQVTENLKNGKLEDMDLDFGSFGTDISNKTKPSSAWSSGPSAKQGVWGAQKPDTAKPQTALPSAATSSTTPPETKPAPEPTPSASVLTKPTPAAKAPAAPEKPEPAVKTGNQNQKGKKGKGKGKK